MLAPWYYDIDSNSLLYSTKKVDPNHCYHTQHQAILHMASNTMHTTTPHSIQRQPQSHRPSPIFPLWQKLHAPPPPLPYLLSPSNLPQCSRVPPYLWAYRYPTSICSLIYRAAIVTRTPYSKLQDKPTQTLLIPRPDTVLPWLHGRLAVRPHHCTTCYSHST